MRPRPAPERRPQRELLTARGAARQQQVGHIDARHEQQESYRAPSAPTERAAHAAHKLVVQYEDRGAPALIQGRQGLFHLCSDAFQFGAHLIETSRGGGQSPSGSGRFAERESFGFKAERHKYIHAGLEHGEAGGSTPTTV